MTEVAAAMFYLAAFGPSDWLTVVLAFVTIAQGGFSAYVGSKLKTIDALTTKVEQRDERVREMAERLVVEKFNAMAAEFRVSVEVLTERLSQFGSDVDKGERVVEHLREETRRLEVASVQAQADFRGWMMEKFATKKELGEMRERINDVGSRRAV